MEFSPDYPDNATHTTGTGLLEILLTVCILSVSLVPLFFVFRLSRPTSRGSVMDFTATMLAHHVMEQIIAKNIADPHSLPSMTDEEPVVIYPESVRQVSKHFRGILGYENGLGETDNIDLYWHLRPYKCNVDTFYLQDNLYKVIVYISYEEDSRIKKVFLERLLNTPPPN